MRACNISHACIIKNRLFLGMPLDTKLNQTKLFKIKFPLFLQYSICTVLDTYLSF